MMTKQDLINKHLINDKNWTETREMISGKRVLETNIDNCYFEKKRKTFMFFLSLMKNSNILQANKTGSIFNWLNTRD